MMAAARKSRVARAFATACSYDEHARVQRRVAEALAGRIAGLPVIAACGDALRLLEIGCGTGFLTRALADRGMGGDWLVTDIAPAMVARCGEAMTSVDMRASIRFLAMDGEAPAYAGQEYDLICSSMTFQWFADLPGSLRRLARLVAPGGTLAFATLLAGTFAEWEDAHRRLGFAPGGLSYPAPAELAAMLPAGGVLSINEMVEADPHPDAAGFLRALKSIGAGTGARRPLAPAALREVMADFDANGAVATYRVVLCEWTRA